MDKAEAIERLEYLKAKAQLALEQEIPEWVADDILGTIEAYDMAIEALQTDPKRGGWIGEADGYYDGELVYDTWYCSNCDYCIEDEEQPTFNFCPNCGCRMKGVDDE